MTKFQKVFCVCLSIVFLLMLLQLTNPLWLIKDLYRQLPLYCFLEEIYKAYPMRDDKTVSELIIEKNAEYLSERSEEENTPHQDEKEVISAKTNVEEDKNSSKGQVLENLFGIQKQYAAWITAELKQAETKEAMSKNVPQKAETKEIVLENVASAAVQAAPLIDLSPEKLADTDYLLSQFYIVDSNTDASVASLNAENFLEKDFSIEKNSEKPQILIYHSHSQETFADSREGCEEDTIVGVGDYLTEILTKQYGYQILHVREAFDMAEGELDRSSAYDYSREYVEKVLEENPSIEVIIDLHRDGISEERHLVTTINGKDTAQIMFYNGLSYTRSYGTVDYLPNPYIQDNLAFSFQLEYQAALYYPKLYRGIYLAGLRYNLHLKPRALLLEAGAQTNTVQEVKNAMEPFADILNRVLTGEKE